MTSPSSLTPQGEIEHRMGLQPVEELLAERDVLVKKVAPLRAVHGPFGTYEAQRHSLAAALAVEIRAKGIEGKSRLTDDAVKALAHSDPRYLAFIAEATTQKSRWVELENLIQGIADTINRGQAVARYLAAEASLAR